MRYAAGVVARQLDLFSSGAPSFDRAFADLERVQLDADAWVDRVAGWVRGHDALFDWIEQNTRWRHERRVMYEREVCVPRLVASFPDDGPRHPLVEDMRLALSRHYREEFVYTTAALYRGGDDSVAWHGDTTARTMSEAVVATVSLGGPRRFLLRPAEGGASIAMELGRGDLVVMGGSCQRTWRHAVPKVARANPRMALMFRPSWHAESSRGRGAGQGSDSSARDASRVMPTR